MIVLKALADGFPPCHCVAPFLVLHYHFHCSENIEKVGGWIEIVQARGNCWVLSPISVGDGRIFVIRFNRHSGGSREAEDEIVMISPAYAPGSLVDLIMSWVLLHDRFSSYDDCYT